MPHELPKFLFEQAGEDNPHAPCVGKPIRFLAGLSNLFGGQYRSVYDLRYMRFVVPLTGSHMAPDSVLEVNFRV